jgi:leucyl/phenylalanyl-tRNA--protein transferase
MGGLLAVGGDLGPARLLDAYRHGIFPWGTVETQPLWYSPDPRMVLFPEEFRLSRSLRKTLRARISKSVSTAISPASWLAAETPRPGQDGTWITPDMMNAYIRLHELGWAHSVETYVEGDWLAAFTAWPSVACSMGNRCSLAAATPRRSPSHI